jgi:hypothetical protein
MADLTMDEKELESYLWVRVKRKAMRCHEDGNISHPHILTLGMRGWGEVRGRRSLSRRSCDIYREHSLC